MIRLGRTYDNYVLFIIFVKILFIICAVITFLLKMKIDYSKFNNDSIIKIYDNLSMFKETLELLFIVSTAFICIIVFYPFYKELVIIDKPTRTLLFLYGFIILITAKWSILTEVPQWFINLQDMIRGK